MLTVEKARIDKVALPLAAFDGLAVLQEGRRSRIPDHACIPLFLGQTPREHVVFLERDETTVPQPASMPGLALVVYDHKVLQARPGDPVPHPVPLENVFLDYPTEEDRLDVVRQDRRPDPDPDPDERPLVRLDRIPDDPGVGIVSLPWTVIGQQDPAHRVTILSAYGIIIDQRPGRTVDDHRSVGDIHKHLRRRFHISLDDRAWVDASPD